MENLPQFSKHIPQLLRQQILTELVLQYLSEEKSSKESNKSQPSSSTASIQRFYGALLFVDISGFTVLSQKLDIEALKNHINDYFAKMLEIVSKWGGDVVKFAGDAIYIVWHTNINNHSGNKPIAGKETVRSSAISYQNSVHGLSQAISQSVEKAVACGLEICAACGHYEVKLESTHSAPGVSNSSWLLDKIMPTFSSLLGHAKVTPLSPATADSSKGSNLAYLDVHTGVSAGLMAGIDIGYGDRWEFFLAGDALSDVALAESEAEKGDVVLSPYAHSLLHPPDKVHKTSDRTSWTSIDASDSQARALVAAIDTAAAAAPVVPVPAPINAAKRQLLATPTECLCGCFLTPGSLFRVSHLSTSLPSQSHHRRMSRARSKTVELDKMNIEALQLSKVSEDIAGEVSSSFDLAQKKMRSLFLDEVEQRQQQQDQQTSSEAKQFLGDRKQRDKGFNDFLRHQVRAHFTATVTKALGDRIVRHVHDVARLDYKVQDSWRKGFYLDLMQQFLADPFGSSKRIQAERLAVRAEYRSDSFTFEDNDDNDEAMTVVAGDKLLTGAQRDLLSSLDHEVEAKVKAKPSSATAAAAATSSPSPSNPAAAPPSADGLAKAAGGVNEMNTLAELRNVTVMFVKIDTFDLTLLVDKHAKRNGSKSKHTAFGYEAFGFLDKTENEAIADQLLAEHLQSCMELLYKAIYDNGGQMRQFIVDDKGTVCIATFGLRGAVSTDNAAAAVEAATRIIDELSSIRLSASIGITTGKAYCGFVGSNQRHEFAVMGPSTNLSARLMCKAAANSMLCDDETVERDRTHEFKLMGEVAAKGYTLPVKTFMPQEDSSISNEAPRFLLKFQTVRHIDPSLRNVTTSRFDVDQPRSLRAVGPTIKKPLDSVQEKIDKLVKSDYYFMQETGASSDDSKTNKVSESKQANLLKLRGRAKEIHDVLYGLFDFASAQASASCLFDVNAPTKVVAICGSGGSGKTVMMMAIGRKLFSASKLDKGLSIFVMKSKPSSLHLKVPFYTWKPIILELLQSVHKTIEALNTGSNNFVGRNLRAGRSPKKGVTSVRGHIRQIYLSGLDKLLAVMAIEDQIFRPLLVTCLNLADLPDNETTAKYQGKVRYQKCADLLSRLLPLCPMVLKKAVLLLIEEVQHMDQWSLGLLHMVWTKGKGLSILLTYNTENKHKDALNWDGDILDMIETGSMKKKMQQTMRINHFDFFKKFYEPKRFCTVELVPMNKDSISTMARDLVKEITGREGGLVLQERDIATIFESSGGNPLYAVEMVKNVVRQEEEAKGREAAGSPTSVASSPVKGGNSQQQQLSPGTGLGAAGAGADAAAVSSPHSSTSDLASFSPKSSCYQPMVVHEFHKLSSMNHRIEEIICYRLDRLNIYQQQLLKAASVATYGGQTFSAELMTFMLIDDDKNKDKNNDSSSHRHPDSNKRAEGGGGGGGAEDPHRDGLNWDDSSSMASQCADSFKASPSDVLFELVKQNEFLVLADSGEEFCEVYFGASTIEHSVFEFQISLEQATIYNLIVDDQKEFFHEKIALYLSSQRRGRQQGQPVLPAALRQEAFHWERSSLWNRALRVYMQCAELERAAGQEVAWVSDLQAAVKMFKYMENESIELLPLPDQRLPHPAILLSMLTDPSLDPALYRQHLIPLREEFESLQEIFEIDLDLLPAVFQMQVDLADAYTHAFEDFEIVAYSLGLALKIFLGAKFLEHCMGQPAKAQRKASIKYSRLLAEQLKETGYRVESSSRLIDQTAIRHFISSYLVAYHFLHLPGRREAQAEAAVSLKLPRGMNLRSSLQLETDHQSTFQLLQVFQDQAFFDSLLLDDEEHTLCLRLLRRIENERWAEAVQEGLALFTGRGGQGKVGEVEGEEEGQQQRSLGRVAHFGYDLLPFVSSLLTQYLALSGEAQDQETRRIYEAENHRIVTSTRHLPSLEYAIALASATWMSRGDYASILAERSYYRSMLAQRNGHVEVLPTSLKPMFVLWFRAYLNLVNEEHLQAFPTEQLVFEEYRRFLSAFEQIYLLPAGSEDELSVTLRSYMRQTGLSLKSLCLQLICGQLLAIVQNPAVLVTVEEIEAAEQLFLLWWSRLVVKDRLYSGSNPLNLLLPLQTLQRLVVRIRSASTLAEVKERLQLPSILTHLRSHLKAEVEILTVSWQLLGYAASLRQLQELLDFFRACC